MNERKIRLAQPPVVAEGLRLVIRVDGELLELSVGKALGHDLFSCTLDSLDASSTLQTMTCTLHVDRIVELFVEAAAA